MATVTPEAGDYDAYAGQYAANVAWREQGGVDGDPFGLLPPLLKLLADIGGCPVLDAGCGEGYLARVLAARGAQVTGIDISPRLIELARAKDPGGDYRVADLSQPVPGTAGCFDAAAGSRSRSTTPTAPSSTGTSSTTSTLVRQAPTAACGKQASRPTTTTGRWRTTSTPSWRPASTSPS